MGDLDWFCSNDEPDVLKWRLASNGVFSVKSMYVDYLNRQTVFLKKIGELK
jgi:hypothetical protein